MTPLQIVENALKQAGVPYYIDEVKYPKMNTAIKWLVFEDNFDSEGNEIQIPFTQNGAWMSDADWGKIKLAYI